jgi:hypothetical protein
MNLLLPRSVDAKSGILKVPEDCTQEEKAAVKFLYEVILPKLTPNFRSSNVWIKNNTYYAILGTKWVYTFATALVLHAHYTNLDNIIKNRDSLNDGENDASANSESDEGVHRKRKKRKRLHNSETRARMYKEYYAFCKFFKDQVVKDEEELKTRMGLWDKLYSPVNKLTNRTPCQRPNICPLEHQLGQDDGLQKDDDKDKAFIEFMMANSLAKKMGIKDAKQFAAV